MAKILRCKHIGPDTSCEFEAKGETEQDILSQVKDHAAKAHHIHEITPELVQQAKANMKDV
jgi:predicted small metal-binding protein